MLESQILNPILTDLSELQAQLEVGSQVENLLGIQSRYLNPIKLFWI